MAKETGGIWWDFCFGLGFLFDWLVLVCFCFLFIFRIKLVKDKS